MIHAKTWKPGTDKSLDDLFEILRENFCQSEQNSLWYTKKHFEQCSALTISFDDDTPIFCSSILERKIWPPGVFRIMNRYWRIGNNHTLLKTISQGSGEMTISQLEWVYRQPNFELAFISRQSDYWQSFIAKEYYQKYGLKFEIDNHNKYLTCDNIKDSTCWQKIIYQGNSNILSQWNRK